MTPRGLHTTGKDAMRGRRSVRSVLYPFETIGGFCSPFAPFPPFKNPRSSVESMLTVVRLSSRSRLIFMQQKPGQITISFAPGTAFEVPPATETDTGHFQIAELLVLPLEEQPTRISLNPLDRRGIPFSAIN